MRDLAPIAALAFAALALAIAGVSLTRPAGPQAPTPEPRYYSVHAFDLSGDGYPVTVNVDLDKATCERQRDAGNNGPGDYLFVCREQ